MADLMNKLAAIALLVPLLLPAAWAAADPTRPPGAWLGQPAGDGLNEAGSSLRLQSVLLPQKGRAVAVISGRTVAVGGRLGDMQLVRLTEREAVLQGADGMTKLYLTPDVDKRMVLPPSRRQAGQDAQGKEKR